MHSPTHRAVTSCEGFFTRLLKSLPVCHFRTRKKQQRPGKHLPEPLPVICWDWTKAIALPRVPVTRPVVSRPPGQIWGLGRDALGLSHLTYRTTGTFFLHQLDQPPFPCIANLKPPPAHRQAPISAEPHTAWQGHATARKPACATRDASTPWPSWPCCFCLLVPAAPPGLPQPLYANAVFRLSIASSISCVFLKPTVTQSTPAL